MWIGYDWRPFITHEGTWQALWVDCNPSSLNSLFVEERGVLFLEVCPHKCDSQTTFPFFLLFYVATRFYCIAVANSTSSVSLPDSLGLHFRITKKMSSWCLTSTVWFRTWHSPRHWTSSWVMEEYSCEVLGIYSHFWWPRKRISLSRVHSDLHQL